MSTGEVPHLEGEAARAVAHRGTHVQIIACAGSGKTEVVAQRVAAIIAEGVDPQQVVAFTFTERAAAELQDRIRERVRHRVGDRAVDMLGAMFVGTIHAYAFTLLQRYVPKYETYDVLDESQHVAFLHREANRLGIKSLREDGGLFDAIDDFIRAVDIVDNELLDPVEIPGAFPLVYHDYLIALEQYRLVTFGQQIVRAVRELQRDEVRAQVQSDLRHVIVDEYQDVNPAQEELIRLLVDGGGVDLCVVGDDDQAVYQWRGSTVENIVNFANRYDDVAQFSLMVNRRCREGIVSAANTVSATIDGRLPKAMLAHRSSDDCDVIELATLGTEAEEAEFIAAQITALHADGLPYSNIAILCRKKAAFGAIMTALEASRIPVQSGGRSGLFDAPEADCLGRLFSWLVDHWWASGRFGRWESLTRDDVLMRFAEVFSLSPRQVAALGELMDTWRNTVEEVVTVDLIDRYYTLLKTLGVDAWDPIDPVVASRMGTLARFSAVIVDYEQVRRRSRPDRDQPGEQVGGEFGGLWYFKNFASFLAYFARSNYEGFGGEAETSVEAVDLLTVHGSKGLEWPVVFVPSVTAKRFDHAGNPQPKETLVPADLYDRDRYSGSDSDERRLFYVALTRARDLVVLTRHETIKKQQVGPSAYFTLLQAVVPNPIGVRRPEAIDLADAPIRITYSELAQYLKCGYAYRLRSVLGFLPRLAPELGFGKAVHHMMRTAAVETVKLGRPLTVDEAKDIVDGDFFLPAANKSAHRVMKASAQRMLESYLGDPARREQLLRTWETERRFTLNLPVVIVEGRADIVFSSEDGTQRLSLIDYKTASGLQDHDIQLQVYADAGRREGLVIEDAYVFDMKTSTQIEVPVDPASIERAEKTVTAAADGLRHRLYPPTKEKTHCRTCDVSDICAFQAGK